MALFYHGQEFAGATGLFLHLFRFMPRRGDLPVEDDHIDQAPGPNFPRHSFILRE